MYGFGDPVEFDEAGGFGADGFGDPVEYDAAGGEGSEGWGDVPMLISGVIQITPNLAVQEYPDSGGDVLVLDNVPLLPAGAAYRVRLKERHTLQYVPADRFGCWGCVPGNSWQCVPDKLGHMRVALPTAPPGEYDIVLNWGANFANTVTVDQMLTVLWRGRQQYSWSMRSHYPPHWREAGARTRQQEKLLGV